MPTLLLTFLLLIQTPEAPTLAPLAHPAAHDVLRGIRIFTMNSEGIQFRGHACQISAILAYTAAHVVDGESQVFGMEDTGTSPRIIHLRVGKVNPEHDLATLHAAEDNFSYWFKRGSVPLPGSPIIGIIVLPNAGSAPSFGNLFGRGEKGVYLSNLPIAMGSSGSCVLDSEGRAWGVSTGRLFWSGPSVPEHAAHQASVHAPLP